MEQNDKEISYRVLDTGGIGYLERLQASPYYFGTDYTSGDLYEAEELFNDGHRISKNRLIFVKFPEGEVFEPVKCEDGQYLGDPVYVDDTVYILQVDFKEKIIRIIGCSEDLRSSYISHEIPLDSVRDCYNLQLSGDPLTLIRQGRENDFQVIWPENGDFEIGPTESFYFRDNDKLIFSKWFEDPDYREETVVRRYPTGDVTGNSVNTVLMLEDGTKWLLK